MTKKIKVCCKTMKDAVLRDMFRIDPIGNIFMGDPCIQYCPWCSTKIELEEEKPKVKKRTREGLMFYLFNLGYRDNLEKSPLCGLWFFGFATFTAPDRSWHRRFLLSFEYDTEIKRVEIDILFIRFLLNFNLSH